MSRRTFLKVAGATAAIATINPLKAFSGIFHEDVDVTDGGEYTAPLGLGNVYIGSVSQHANDTRLCLKNSLGLADLKILTSTDLTEVKNGFPLVGVEQDHIGRNIFSVKCIFKNEPYFGGATHRIEIVVGYPDSKTFMAIILPKARMTKGHGAIIFTAMSVGHSAWSKAPFGRIYIGEKPW